MIDKAKTYKTRYGQAVRIYATDCDALYPIHGAIQRNNGSWWPESWTVKGLRFFERQSPDDLIEVKPRIMREVWLNVYPEGESVTFLTKKEADKWRGDDAVACVKLTIDCEEGEGL